ncbi:MAG: hypothetical protein RBT60_14900 [Candidatus Krumholzibacteria bacterium]|jgi:hypothetical protein|nr:hypothetical protein [Candidatus Krumholzibacteria bacterium]
MAAPHALVDRDLAGDSSAKSKQECFNRTINFLDIVDEARNGAFETETVTTWLAQKAFSHNGQDDTWWWIAGPDEERVAGAVRVRPAPGAYCISSSN